MEVCFTAPLRVPPVLAWAVPLNRTSTPASTSCFYMVHHLPAPYHRLPVHFLHTAFISGRMGCAPAVPLCCCLKFSPVLGLRFLCICTLHSCHYSACTVPHHCLDTYLMHTACIHSFLGYLSFCLEVRCLHYLCLCHLQSAVPLSAGRYCISTLILCRLFSACLTAQIILLPPPSAPFCIGHAWAHLCVSAQEMEWSSRGVEHAAPAPHHRFCSLLLIPAFHSGSAILCTCLHCFPAIFSAWKLSCLFPAMFRSAAAVFCIAWRTALSAPPLSVEATHLPLPAPLFHHSLHIEFPGVLCCSVHHTVQLILPLGCSTVHYLQILCFLFLEVIAFRPLEVSSPLPPVSSSAFLPVCISFSA